MTPKVCAITGAGGYLGSRVCAALRLQGWMIAELSRSKVDAVPFTLASGPPEGYFREAAVDVFIHCAWDFSLIREDDIHQQNVAGSIRVLEQARHDGVPTIIFISTMSAFEGCRSRYGRAKLAVEQRALQLGATVVRPGLIFGDDPGSIVGAMTKAIDKLPVVPLIGGGKQVLYPCHEDDLTCLLVEIASSGAAATTSPIIAASPRGRQLREILATIAEARGRKPRVIPIPWRMVWGLLSVAEALGLRPGFRSDSVISLVNQEACPDFRATRETGVIFRDFANKDRTSGRLEPAGVAEAVARPGAGSGGPGSMS